MTVPAGLMVAAYGIFVPLASVVLSVRTPCRSALAKSLPPAFFFTAAAKVSVMSVSAFVTMALPSGSNVGKATSSFATVSVARDPFASRA